MSHVLGQDWGDDGPEPDVVFHYTSLDVLTKIVENRELWATSISYLNDTSERQFYIDAALQRLPRVLSSVPEFERIIDAEPFREDMRELDASSLLQTFVCSFSAEGDSLPQWRSYTPAGVGVPHRISCERFEVRSC